MKKSLIILAGSFGFLAGAGLFNPCLAQKQTKEQKKQAQAARLKASVDASHYVFNAQTAIPLSGRSRQLTSSYTLKIRPDSVISDLPYFGRAYVATIGSAEGGMHFTSTKFEYKSVTNKDSSWQITIKPKDQSVNYQFNLNISRSGYANLQVTSSDRQPISFYGQVDDSK